MAAAKNWYESKTMWLGVAAAVLGGLEIFAGVLRDSGITGPIVTAIGVLVVILRTLTERPIKR